MVALPDRDHQRRMKRARLGPKLGIDTYQNVWDFGILVFLGVVSGGYAYTRGMRDLVK